MGMSSIFLIHFHSVIGSNYKPLWTNHRRYVWKKAHTEIKYRLDINEILYEKRAEENDGHIKNNLY